MQLRAVCTVGASIVAAFAIGAGRYPAKGPVSSSAVGEESRFQVTFLFRAADCRLAASLIGDLASLQDDSGVVVDGIMLGGPEGIDERRSLIAELDLGFPAEIDTEEWSERVKREGLDLPLLVLRDRDRIVGMISPSAFAVLRAFTPHFMVSEFPGWSAGP